MKFIFCFILLTLHLHASNLTKNLFPNPQRHLSSGNLYEMVEKIISQTKDLNPEGYSNISEPSEIDPSEPDLEFTIFYFREDEKNQQNNIHVSLSGDSDESYSLTIIFTNPLSKSTFEISHAKYEYEKENIDKYYKNYKEELESLDFTDKNIIKIVKEIISSFNTDFFEIVLKKEEEVSFCFLANSKVDEENDDGGDHFFEVFIENNSLVIKNDFFQNSFSLNVPTKENLDKEIIEKLKGVLEENERLKKFSQTDNKEIEDIEFDCEKINIIWKKIHIFNNYDFELENNQDDSFSKVLNLKNPDGEKNNIGTFTCEILENDLRLIFIKLKITDFENFEQSFPDGGLYNIESIIEGYLEKKLHSIIQFIQIGGKAEKIDNQKNPEEIENQKNSEEENLKKLSTDNEIDNQSVDEDYQKNPVSGSGSVKNSIDEDDEETPDSDEDEYEETESGDEDEYEDTEDEDIDEDEDEDKNKKKNV